MLLARPHVSAALLGLAAACLFATPAGAQQVFRIVGPDGRVTFSDKPPADAKLAPVAPAAGVASPVGPSLPLELRQVASRYPVTLYTGDKCGPCGAGRAFLLSRGIPFTEKTVVTPQDGDALQRLAGDNSLPLVTIGSQQLKGYSDSEWGHFLDAAGYPARSVLPASWKNPPASPMVAVQRPTPATAPTSETPADKPVTRAASPAPVAPADNPAGIKF